MERPITSGRVSVPQAVAWLGVQCFAGLAVLLSLPFECFYLGALSLPFVAAYPLFKRFTYYPQAMLSICFSWGCLLGFPAVGAPLNLWVAVPLFISNWIWCLTYDTIYAHQDKKFDIKVSSLLRWHGEIRLSLFWKGWQSRKPGFMRFLVLWTLWVPGFTLLVHTQLEGCTNRLLRLTWTTQRVVGVHLRRIFVLGLSFGMELCLTIYCCYLDTSKSFLVRRLSALDIDFLIKTSLYCWVWLAMTKWK